jgi:hypothetical protein
MKRFGKPEAKAEKSAESTASEKKTPQAKPGMGDKAVAEKPNASGAEPEGGDVRSRHAEELTAMHKRHQQAYTDMHSIHADEMKQMHTRHATEIGNGAGAKASEGPALPSAKKAAGKGWKTKSEGTSGTEPKK